MADVANPSLNKSVGDTAVSSLKSSVKKDKMMKKKSGTHAKPSHPPTSQMVNGAINGLKERGGSSLQAIKKYMSANYKVDSEKMAPFIRKYLKSAVESGTLIRTKGKGASGSFKLASASLMKPASTDKKPTKKTKTVTVSGKDRSTKKTTAKSQSSAGAKARIAASIKKTAAKKPSTPKRTKKAAANVDKPTEKAKQAPETPKKKTAKVSAAIAVATKTKSPVKTKESTKSGPTRKPKSPKPNSTKASPKTRKAAAPKKK